MRNVGRSKIHLINEKCGEKQNTSIKLHLYWNESLEIVLCLGISITLVWSEIGVDERKVHAV
jgi:hypothetical protein